MKPTTQKVKYEFLQDSEESEIFQEIDYPSLLDLEKKDFSLSPRKDQEFIDSLQNISPESDIPKKTSDSIVFYCKDCKSEQEVIRINGSSTSRKSLTKKGRGQKENKKIENNKIQFKCQECKNRNIVYGTKRGIKEYFDRVSQ